MESAASFTYHNYMEDGLYGFSSPNYTCLPTSTDIKNDLQDLEIQRYLENLNKTKGKDPVETPGDPSRRSEEPKGSSPVEARRWPPPTLTGFALENASRRKRGRPRKHSSSRMPSSSTSGRTVNLRMEASQVCHVNHARVEGQGIYNQQMSTSLFKSPGYQGSLANPKKESTVTSLILPRQPSPQRLGDLSNLISSFRKYVDNSIQLGPTSPDLANQTLSQDQISSFPNQSSSHGITTSFPGDFNNIPTSNPLSFQPQEMNSDTSEWNYKDYFKDDFGAQASLLGDFNDNLSHVQSSHVRELRKFRKF